MRASSRQDVPVSTLQRLPVGHVVRVARMAGPNGQDHDVVVWAVWDPILHGRRAAAFDLDSGEYLGEVSAGD